MNIKKLTHKDFFYCYSNAMMKFLNAKGLNPVITGLHTQTKNKFYAYQILPELHEALQEWEIRKVMSQFRPEQEKVEVQAVEETN